VAILVLYLLTIIWLRPAANFGAIQDDAIYFASAKAIAAGQGYILPSFPGTLAHLKYPEFYPWLLSWIWRIDPAFPRNLSPAIALTLVLGCWFLVAGYFLARRTFDLAAGWLLAVTAACAFNFFSLVLSGSVLSDFPFAALALTALVAADRSFGSGTPATSWWWMAAAGALAGLSVGMRTVGVMVAAGILLFAALRRRWRQAGVFCLFAGAFSLPWLLPVLLRTLSAHSNLATGAPAASGLPASAGWTQTVAFYTSYFGQWRQFVPTWHVQAEVIGKNLLSVLEDPGIFLLLPLANRSGLISVLAGSALALAAWSGILLAGRRLGWRLVHLAFLFYLAMVLPWPFPPHRFLVPFLPLLMGGVAVTVREAAGWVAAAIRAGSPIDKRAGAAGLGAALVAVGALAAINLGYAVPWQLAQLMRSQRSLLGQKTESYRWIREHTPAGARFIAYDDVLLYLYTGRQAVRPIACSSAASYANDPSYAERDADHLADVSRHVAANYWVVTTADFATELGPDERILQARERRLLGSLPLVFSSDDGRVRIYDLARF
jgi:hypothetical protein